MLVASRVESGWRGTALFSAIVNMGCWKQHECECLLHPVNEYTKYVATERKARVAVVGVVGDEEGWLRRSCGGRVGDKE